MNRDAGPCVAEGCLGKAWARGLCNNHYQAARKSGSIERISEEIVCSVEGCTETAVGRGLCGKHAQRVRKYGDPEGGQRHDTIVIDDDHKTCSVCGEIRHREAFTLSKRGKLGRSAKCLECQNRQFREREDYRIAKQRGRKKRKAALRSAETFEISTKDLRRIEEGPCFACGRSEEITFDHVVPISRGGRHSIGNAIPLCLSCNASKQDRLLVEWLPGRREWLTQEKR